MDNSRITQTRSQQPCPSEGTRCRWGHFGNVFCRSTVSSKSLTNLRASPKRRLVLAVYGGNLGGLDAGRNTVRPPPTCSCPSGRPTPCGGYVRHGQAAKERGQAAQWGALVAQARSASAGGKGLPLAACAGHARAGGQAGKVGDGRASYLSLTPCCFCVLLPCALLSLLSPLACDERQVCSLHLGASRRPGSLSMRSDGSRGFLVSLDGLPLRFCSPHLFLPQAPLHTLGGY